MFVKPYYAKGIISVNEYVSYSIHWQSQTLNWLQCAMSASTAVIKTDSIQATAQRIINIQKIDKDWRNWRSKDTEEKKSQEKKEYSIRNKAIRGCNTALLHLHYTYSFLPESRKTILFFRGIRSDIEELYMPQMICGFCGYFKVQSLGTKRFSYQKENTCKYKYMCMYNILTYVTQFPFHIQIANDQQLQYLQISATYDHRQ